MADPFVAEIRIFPFNFAPRGWALCDGQLLPLSQNTALFSLLGTTYGGDGKSTFALPDLQGRVPMHPGQGPGLSLHDLGETSGSDSVTLLQSEIPVAHPHAARAQRRPGRPSGPRSGAQSRQVRGRDGLQGARRADHDPGQPDPGAGRLRASAQQPPALPDPELQHRAAGRLPAEELSVQSAPASSAVVTLRPTADTDREFLVALYGSTRADELDQVEWGPGEREAFVRMQFEAQDTDYRARNPHGTFDVILRGDQPVGRLYVDRRDGDIRIVDISLIPAARGAGVGSSLITALQAEAAAASCRVSIHVEVHNPAAELYSRLGFVEVSERGVYRLMEWQAS